MLKRDNKMRIYKIVDYPKKGELYGEFKSKYPYLAAHKIVNFLNVTNEQNLNMAKFWIREYKPIDLKLLKLIKYVKHKILQLSTTELKMIFKLLIINILIDNKVVKNIKNIEKIDMSDFMNLFKELDNNEIQNLISLLLVNYYKKYKINKSNISDLLHKNLQKTNTNSNKKYNLTFVIVSNKKVKISKIYQKLISKFYVNHHNNNSIDMKRLKRNLRFC